MNRGRHRRPTWVSPAMRELVSRHLWRYPDASVGEVVTVVRSHLPSMTRAEVEAAIAELRADNNDSSNEKEN